MIVVDTFSNNILKYSCDCGIYGKCLIRPQDSSAKIVFDLECPYCLEVTRIVLKQTDDQELTWAVIVDNDLEDLNDR